MLITRSGVRDMIQQILSDDRYGTRGHDQEDLAQDVVVGLSLYVKNGPEFLCLPDAILPFIDGTTLGDIVAGYGRPLGYLCSDCRYPKWCMTPAEVLEKYGNVSDWVARANNPLPNVSRT